METLALTGPCDITQKENTLRIKLDGVSRSFPLSDIQHLLIMSDSTITTKLLCLLGRYGIRASFFDHYGWYKGSFEPIERMKSGELCIRQAAVALDDAQRLAIARTIVEGAAGNMIRNIAYHSYRGQIDSPHLKRLTPLSKEFDRASSIEILMGMEGRFRKEYLALWPILDANLAFGPRKKRPPNNEINCLISFLNGLTYATVRHEIFKTHLNETISFLHAAGSARSSLSLDIAEIFKPVLADRLIFRFVRKGQMSTDWFDFPGSNICVLTRTGRQAVTAAFTEALERQKNERSLRDEMRATCLSLERHIWKPDAWKFTPYKSRV